MVETNMTWPLKSGLFVMKPEDFARQALDTLDLTSQTPGCLNHAVQVLSPGGPRQRAQWNSTWPGLTCPQEVGGETSGEGEGPHGGWGSQERRWGTQEWRVS